MKMDTFAFYVGKTFSDYKALESEVQGFKSENFVKLSKSECRKIKAAAARYPRREFKADLVYAELKYCCHHGGKNFSSRSTGARPNQTTGKIGCPFHIRLRTAKDGQSLEVVKIDTNQNGDHNGQNGDHNGQNGISSHQRNTALKNLERLAYSLDETYYLENYEDFKPNVPASVLAYFNTNWHSIRDQWMRGLKAYYLGNDTT